MSGPRAITAWEIYDQGEEEGWIGNGGEDERFFQLGRAVANMVDAERVKGHRSRQQWIERVHEESDAIARGELPPRIPDYVAQYGDIQEENPESDWSSDDDDGFSNLDTDIDYDNVETDDEPYDSDTDNEMDILDTEDEEGSDYDGDDENEDIIFRTRYLSLVEHVDSGREEIEQAVEEPADQVGEQVAGDFRAVVEYLPVDYALLHQPLHAWDEFEGDFYGEDYYHGGVVHNHHQMGPEEQAIHDAMFAADMEELGGDRGYCSDFEPDEDDEADLRWEEYGVRMTDPEDEGDDDQDDNHDDRDLEDDEMDQMEDQEEEDWDVSNPI